MGQGRRQFMDEFKREAVALLASSGRPLTQIAAELGIASSMLRNWRGRSGGRNAGPALRPNTLASAPHFVPDPAAERGGWLCLDRFSRLISGTSAGCRRGLPFPGWHAGRA